MKILIILFCLLSNSAEASICDIVFQEAAMDGFPTGLDVLTIISVESDFKPKAFYKKSVGLMMVQAKDRKLRKKLQEPLLNIQAGVALLESYDEILGSPEAAIKAYNVGIGNYQSKRFKKSAQTYWAKFRVTRKKVSKGYEEICNN